MTIREIARLAGVSPATVSRVFNHHPGIGEDVRRKVLEIAHRHHYSPHMGGKRRNVVIITPGNAEFPVQSCVDMLLMALMRTLPPLGFHLEILPLNNLERLENIQFCAAVSIGVEPEELADWSDRFAVPLVVVDREVKQQRPNVFQVRSDESGGMQLALRHLQERGCRKIGCLIHGDPDHGNAAIRYAAIRRELQNLGYPEDDRLIHFTGNGTERYVELIGKLLKLGCDALFCPGGTGGIVASYALSLFDRKVPEEVSIIASEQTFYSRFAVPPQTTVTQDYPAVAEAVGELIRAWIDHQHPTSPAPLPYCLLKRESVTSLQGLSAQ